MMGPYGEIAGDGMFSAIRAGRSPLITLLPQVSRFPRHWEGFLSCRVNCDETNRWRRGEADFDPAPLALRTPSPGFGMALARYHGCLVAHAKFGVSMREYDSQTITHCEPR